MYILINIMFCTVNILVSILALVTHLLIIVTIQTGITVSSVILPSAQIIPQVAAMPIPGCLVHLDPRSNLTLVAWTSKVLTDRKAQHLVIPVYFITMLS
jgi:hypothetical protein